MTAGSVFRRVATPLGTMIITAREGALTSAHFEDQLLVPRAFVTAMESQNDPFLARATAVLLRYFSGVPLPGDLPLAPTGTPFQRSVWDAITRVPHARTATYREIAKAIGAPRSVRAVGAATGRNPLCIFIPCHRILGSDGGLTGYAGGLERKRELLALERMSQSLARAA